MANNFLNTNWVSMDILRLLLNKLEVAEYFNRAWERDFEKEFAPSAAITVKFPQRFLTSDGMGYAPQGINRISTTVSLVPRKSYARTTSTPPVPQWPRSGTTAAPTSLT